MNGLALPRLAREGHLWIIRDDELPGGTKRRVLREILAVDKHDEFVYGGPALGYAQVALAYAAQDAGGRAVCFLPKRKVRHPLTEEAERAGAAIHEILGGMLWKVQARAKTYAAETGARFFPLGFDFPDFHEGLEQVARGMELEPEEVWVCAGSGVLTRALQRAWPGARHFAVRIGRPPDAGAAEVLNAPEPFDEPARRLPPFPSSPWYDAKVWQFAKDLASPGALVWNVGA